MALTPVQVRPTLGRVETTLALTNRDTQPIANIQQNTDSRGMVAQTAVPGFQATPNSGAISFPRELESIVNNNNSAITVQRGNNNQMTGIDFTTDYQTIANKFTAAVGTGLNPIKAALEVFGYIQRERLSVPISINGEPQSIDETSVRLIGSTEQLISKNKEPYSFMGTYAQAILGFFESLAVPENQVKYFGNSQNYQRVKNSITDAATALKILSKTAAGGVEAAKDGISKGGNIAKGISDEIGKITGGGGGAPPAG